MLAARIELILLLTGLATAGALVLCLVPVPTMKMLFGQAPADALGILIVRHWGLLVCLVGALIVYAAYHAEVRVPTLLVAIVEKAALALGVLLSPFRRRPAVLVVALADAGMATVYLMYLTGLQNFAGRETPRHVVEEKSGFTLCRRRRFLPEAPPRLLQRRVS